jgi:Tfp pilus assembly protein PilN
MAIVNLLPPEQKKTMSYARKNAVLVRWLTALGLVTIGAIVLFGFGILYIRSSTTMYQTQVKQTQEQLKIQKLDDTQKRVEDISNSLKLVVTVLSKQVLFSQLLNQIGSAVPEGAVLTGLSINKLQGGIDLTAAATDYQHATQVQVNLQDAKNRIFQKADIVGIQCSAATSSSSASASQLDNQYPCKITVRALFSSSNPYTFINSKGTTP